MEHKGQRQMNNEKYKYFMAVFNADKEKTTDTASISGWLSVLQDQLLLYNNADFVATIIHDKDTLESGEIKTIHLHAFIELKEKATKKQFLAELSEYLDIDTHLISLEGSNSAYLGVQYLTHKNQKDKYQYDTSLVKTDNRELYEQRLENVYIDPQQKIFGAMKEAKTMTEFIELTDIGTAQKFRNLFKDIKEEQKLSYQQVITQLERYEYNFNQLETELNLLFDVLFSVMTSTQKEIAKLDERKKLILSRFFDF